MLDRDWVPSMLHHNLLQMYWNAMHKNFPNFRKEVFVCCNLAFPVIFSKPLDFFSFYQFIILFTWNYQKSSMIFSKLKFTFLALCTLKIGLPEVIFFWKMKNILAPNTLYWITNLHFTALYCKWWRKKKNHSILQQIWSGKG